MAFVLIPDGFTLKKVTKPQQDAVDEYFGRERRKSYLNNLIDNPATITLVVSAITGVVIAPIIKDLFEEGLTYASDEIAEKLNPVTIITTLQEKRGPFGEGTSKSQIEELPETNEELDESLWANIHKKRQRIKRGSGEKMRKKGEKGAPTPAQMKRAKGEEIEEKAPDTSDAMKRYKAGKAGFTDIAHLKATGKIKRADGTKKKSPKYEESELNEWGEVTEKAEYDGRPVDLNNPTKGDRKKYKVYVKNEKGNVVKVEFGDPNMEIKRDDPGRRANFRARHNCDNPGPKYKARYWSCKFWSAKSVTDLMKG